MTRDTDLEATIVATYVVMAPTLDERGHGLARQAIANGRRELAPGVLVTTRIRRVGAGRASAG